MSAVEIMESLSLKHRPISRDNYLHPLLNLGLIEMTIPDKPTSQLQKYLNSQNSSKYPGAVYQWIKFDIM